MELSVVELEIKVAGDDKIKRKATILTANQAAEDIGCKTNDINMRMTTVSTATKSTYLDHCFPFKSSDKNGPKFVVKNEKYEEYKKSYKSRKKK